MNNYNLKNKMQKNIADKWKNFQRYLLPKLIWNHYIIYRNQNTQLNPQLFSKKIIKEIGKQSQTIIKKYLRPRSKSKSFFVDRLTKDYHHTCFPEVL